MTRRRLPARMVARMASRKAAKKVIGGCVVNPVVRQLGHPECRRSRQGRDGIGIPDAKGVKPSGRLSDLRVQGYP